MLVDFEPGLVFQRSIRRNKGNWRDSHLVRWDSGTMKPIGGWSKTNSGPFASKLVAMHQWSGNTGVRYTAYLCYEHCYVEINGDEFIDITPTDGIAPPPIADQGGYGDGLYGADVYGTPRDTPGRRDVAPPCFTLGNWGEDLLAMTSSDGRLLQWSPSAPTVELEAVENAPVNNRSFTVTPERVVMIFGAGGDSRKFQWSDQEDNTEWTPSTTSKAGEYFVEPASPIVAHINSPYGILMFTAKMPYIIKYIGLPYVYSYEPINEAPPPYSPASLVSLPQGILWGALNGFWIYNGVSAEPISCDIWDWVNDSIDPLYSRVYASMVNIHPKFEVWFFFTAKGSNHNNRLAIFNYKERIWYTGYIGRTCGISFPNNPDTFMSDGQFVYKHEEGYAYTDAERPWAESFTLNVANGSSMATIMQMLPEVSGGASSVVFRFVKRNNPTGGPESTSGPKPIRNNGYVDVRETARDMRMRVEMVGEDDWSLGPVDFEVTQRGTK